MMAEAMKAYGEQGGRHRHKGRHKGHRSVAGILFLVFGFLGAIPSGLARSDWSGNFSRNR